MLSGSGMPMLWTWAQDDVNADLGVGPWDMQEKGHGNGWCNFDEHLGGFAKVYTDFSTKSFFIDLTDVLKDGKPLKLMATAMSVGGAFVDGVGQISRLGMPLEEQESTMYEFVMSDDGLTVDVYRPQLGLRSTDPQSKEALRKGAGSGWLGGFPTFACSEEGYMAPRGQLPEGHNGQRLIIDGSSLLRRGFMVASLAAQAVSSYRLLKVQSFPRNLDVTVELVTTAPRVASEVGFSLVLLPDEPMPPRAGDDRLLYFTQDYVDIGQRLPKKQGLASEAVDRPVSAIWRYNLPALPHNQIRIYVDPTVPARWQQSVREGVEGWNDAFELIGLPKNTVRAVLPSDPDWPEDYDMNDVRFSTISWSLSEQVSSMGIAKVDPRSGEILKSDIMMSDGWVQAWLSDLDRLSPNFTFHRDARSGPHQPVPDPALEGPRASLAQLALLGGAAEVGDPSSATEGKAKLTRRQLVSDGIRSIVMHETGHILGLRHNFKGSLGISFECTQDMSCSAKHGLTASVMDYLPMNTPAELGREVHAFSPVIGAYDKLAIAYGYRPLPGKDTSIDGYTPPELLSILEEAEAYPTCYDEGEYDEDPACMPYDMTADPIRYGEEQLKLFAEAQQRLLDMTVAPGEAYVRYGAAVDDLLWRAQSVASDLLLWVGGVSKSNAHRGLDGASGRAARQPVSSELQRRALQTYLGVLRPERLGLVPPPENAAYMVWAGHKQAAGHVKTFDVGGRVRDLVASLTTSLISSEAILRVYRSEPLPTPGSAALRTSEFLDLAIAGIVGDGLDVRDAQEWHLHRQLVLSLKTLYSDEALPVELKPRVLFHLRYLSSAVEAARGRVHDQSGWSACAREGQVCSCSGLVRYGDADLWSAAQAISNATACNNTNFGDPAPHHRKRCECLPASPQEDDLLRGHLLTLHRDLAELFCGAEGVPCPPPPEFAAAGGSGW
mmetsp:Transcript_4457/g.16895  ORF Transcript_4457/g.16895 Transcript_4457/m.16895 type:complete len:946 (-) Transcript_4457:27-2864(-)